MNVQKANEKSFNSKNMTKIYSVTFNKSRRI